MDEIEYVVRYTTLYDTVLYPYMQSVFNRVIAAHPEFKHCRLILTRSPVENAFAFGDGTLLFNVGLLSKLNNESQVAFVICHELSHGWFNHVQAGLKKRLDSYFDKDFQKQIRIAKNEKYDINKKIKTLLVSFTMNQLYNMRVCEKQADSLGYFLLLKTNYDASQGVSTLALLNKIEDPYYPDFINFGKYFNCSLSNYEFKHEVPVKGSIFMVKKEKDPMEEGDSLSSHPDCPKRIVFLQDLMKSSPADFIKPADNILFDNIRLKARYEVVQSWYDYEYYDYALYNTLQMLEQNYSNNYLNAMVVLCLYQLKVFMQAHDYAEVVSNISDKNPKNFNDLLYTLNSIGLTDIDQFSRCFSLNLNVDTNDEFLLAALYASARIRNDEPMTKKFRLKYEKLYKDGRFSRLIQDQSALK